MSLERYTLKNGLISFSYKFRHRGVWYRGYIGPTSPGHAKLVEYRARILAAEGRHPLPKRQQVAVLRQEPVPTFDAFTDRFLQWYATDARPGSVRTYTARLNVHILPFFGSRRLTEATTALLDAYRTIRRQEGAAPSSINGELTTLSRMLTKAVEWDLIPRSSRGRITWLRVEEKPVRVLSPEEEARLILAATPRLKPLLKFALQTGLRRAELERLTPADLDLPRSEVTVLAIRSKSRRRRVVPLNTAALAALQEAMPAHGRCFGYYSVGTMSDEAFKRAGLQGLSLHTLRRTFASRCLEAGINVELVRQWMGHSKLTMTQRYLSISEDHAHEAIELLGRRDSHRQSPSA